MTTDITELAQSLKAAAEKATPGEWWSDVVETGGTHGSGEDCMEGFHSYAVYDQNNHSLLDMTNSTAAVITVEDDGDYVMAWDEVARRNAEFITLANPANILALVEALEKAQAKATQQGNIACALLDEVTQLRRHADEKAPELRAQLIEADSELEALRQRIAELESFHTAYMAWSDKTDWVRTDRRFDVVKPLGKHLADVLKAYIEHLESRTVTVKLPPRAPENLACCLEGYEKWLIATTFRDTWNKCLDEVMRTTDAGIKWEAE